MSSFMAPSPHLVSRYVPGPSQERGHALKISAHPSEAKIIYGFGKYVVVRSLESPTEDNFIYRGHKYAIGAAQFAPNGHWVASGDAGGCLKVWAWDNPEHPTKLDVQVMGGAILDLAWDGESKRIVVCGDGKGAVAKCVMWDTGNAVGEMVGHAKKAIACAFKPTRPFRIATGSEDFKVVFYKGPPFKMDHSMNDHKNYVNCVAFSPVSESSTTNTLVSVGSDKKLMVYDASEGTKIKEVKAKSMLKNHQGSIYSVAFSPADANIVMTASADKTCKLWNISEGDSGTLLNSVSLGTAVGDMQTAALWPKALSHPLSFSLEGSCNYLPADLSGSKPTKVVEAPRAPISALAISSSSSMPIVGCNDGTVFGIVSESGEWQKFKNAHNADLLKQPEKAAHQGKITAVEALTSSSEEAPATLVATAGFDDKIKFASIAADTGALSYVSDGVKVDGQPCALAAAPDGSGVFFATTKGVGLCSSPALEKDPVKVSTFKSTMWDPTKIVADATSVIVGARDGVIRILDPTTLKEVKALPPHRGEITALALAPSKLAAGDADRDIKLYALPSFDLELHSIWRYHSSRVTALAFRADSYDHLASTANDETIYVWRLDKPHNVPAKFDFTHKDGVTALAWLDKDHLLSVGNDATALKWKPPGLIQPEATT